MFVNAGGGGGTWLRQVSDNGSGILATDWERAGAWSSTWWFGDGANGRERSHRVRRLSVRVVQVPPRRSRGRVRLTAITVKRWPVCRPWPQFI